jgi:ANTAR domain
METGPRDAPECGTRVRRCLSTDTGRARRRRWRAFSAVLADLLAQVRAAEAKAAHLESALATNRRIGIAVGILMCRLQLPEDRALAVLWKHSQDHNVKVRDLAEEVIYTGTRDRLARPGRDRSATRRRRGAGCSLPAPPGIGCRGRTLTRPS